MTSTIASEVMAGTEELLSFFERALFTPPRRRVMAFERACYCCGTPTRRERETHFESNEWQPLHGYCPRLLVPSKTRTMPNRHDRKRERRG